MSEEFNGQTDREYKEMDGEWTCGLMNTWVEWEDGWMIYKSAESCVNAEVVCG